MYYFHSALLFNRVHNIHIETDMTPTIVIVAAHGRHRELGRQNTIPWTIKEDMRHFRRVTMGKTVLMGRKTAESIGRPLSGRKNLILTRGDTPPYPGQSVVHSLEEALAQTDGDELMVIGGGEVYAQTLPLADKLIITYVAIDVPDADTFFPEVDQSLFTMTSAVPHMSETADPSYAFWTFQRN